MNEERNRLFYIDCLTVYSALSVVLLHCNSVFWSHPTGRLWWSSTFIETFFYPAVPCFFMITGALLIDFG